MSQDVPRSDDNPRDLMKALRASVDAAAVPRLRAQVTRLTTELAEAREWIELYGEGGQP